MIQIFFFIAVILSLLSQLPILLETGLDAYLKLSWIPLTIMILLKYPSDIFNRKIIFFYFFIILFGWYLFLIQGYSGREYIFSGGDLYNIAISCLIFVDCFIFWKHYASLAIYRRIVLLIITGCLILGVVVYIFFLQFADMSSTTYAYSAKNSLGQILFVGGVMGLTGLKLFPSKFSRNFLIGSIIILFVIVMLLKSRATILCIAFIFAYYMTKHGTKRQRLYITLLALFIALVILLNESAYNLVVVNIIFANRNASSASSLSSGRSELIMEALNIINDNYMIGIGHKYLDCMPISLLLQYGIFGLIIVFGFLILLAIKVNYLSRTSVLNTTTFLIFWAFMLNSLFEAYPPFGPGVKCFPLWMMLGFSFANNRNIHKLSWHNN